MATNVSRAVLITGCSSGIGRSTARYLAMRGWTVVATARRIERLTDLEEAGCRLLPLDVTDEGSMEAAVARATEEVGAIGVLINNAGYSQSGAVESVPMELVRRQFETNVFGVVRMTQLVLPGMRRQRWGKIVNVSSMGGRLTFPGAGYYHASKYAIEAFTDALRFEVAGFGIDAILIEPGLIRTGFGEAATSGIAEMSRDNDPYSEFNRAIAKTTLESYVRGPLARLGGEPEDVARAIERAVASEHPRARYTVTPSAKVLITLRRVLPDSVWDRFLHSSFPQPHPTEGSPRNPR